MNNEDKLEELLEKDMNRGPERNDDYYRGRHDAEESIVNGCGSIFGIICLLFGAFLVLGWIGLLLGLIK